MIRTALLVGFYMFFFIPFLFAHGDLHEQIEQISQAIQQEPNKAALYLQRGQLYSKHDKFEAALQDYLTARKLDEQLLITDLLLAQLLAKYQKNDLALSYINTFLVRHPQNSNALTIRAGIFKQKKNMSACQTDLEQAFSHLKTPHPSHFVEMAEAVLLADASNVNEALTWLQKGQAHFGFDIVLKEKEMDLWLQGQNYDEALNTIDDILEQFPRKEKWLFKKATIYEHTQQMELTKTYYQATLEAIHALPKRLQHSSKMLELEAQALEKLQFWE